MSGDSTNQNDRDNQRKEEQDPDVVPPSLESAQQKARERGHWLKEAIVKGGMSGAVRAIVEEGINYLG